MVHIRPGIRDIWNAYMAQDAIFTEYDIPHCPTTAKEIPKSIITWEDAKSIYKKRLRGSPVFMQDAFICFYMDDYKFDGAKGVWHESGQALNVIRHFAGVITPDFSTYQDFPEPIKIYATYRMRLFGYWLGKNGIAVINNVRWGSPETWKYCYNGIDKNSIVYGSANYKCFDELKELGINIVAFPSQTSVAFERRKSHE